MVFCRPQQSIQYIAIFELIGSTRWEAGSYKLRSIGVGLVVFVGVCLVVQPCFATEALELARPTLSKREDIQGKKGIADRLWC